MLKMHQETPVGFYIKCALFLPDKKNLNIHQILVKCLISKVHEYQLSFSRCATCERLGEVSDALVQTVIAKALSLRSVLPKEHRV
jgi:hypothetical protein